MCAEANSEKALDLIEILMKMQMFLPEQTQKQNMLDFDLTL